MKVIIASSRSITDYEKLLSAIYQSKLIHWEITEVVSGTARGVDKLGERYAKEKNIPLKQFPAQWGKYGKSAGYKRNQEMAGYADAAIILWDGKSKGTKHMYEIAKRYHMKVLFLDYSKVEDNNENK